MNTTNALLLLIAVILFPPLLGVILVVGLFVLTIYLWDNRTKGTEKNTEPSPIKKMY